MKKITFFNILMIIICIFGGVIYSISTIQKGDLYGTLIRLSIIGLVLLPLILKKHFHVKITDKMECIYLLFLFLALFLGSIVNLYHKVEWYDNLIHYLSGGVTFFVGYFIYVKWHGESNSFIEFIFLLSFTALIACSWEIFEFISDKIFDKDAQYVISTGVDDTMLDMILALLGCISIQIIDFLEKKLNKNYFISRYKKETRDLYS